MNTIKVREVDGMAVIVEMLELVLEGEPALIEKVAQRVELPVSTVRWMFEKWQSIFSNQEQVDASRVH